VNLASRETPTIPLPELSPNFAVDFVGGEVGLRRFGIFESDLAIDFAADNSATLVTNLLEQCAHYPNGILPDGFFRALSVGKRLECLLTLAAGEERSPFNFQFNCGGCGAELEIELTLDEIAAIQREADLTDVINVEVGGEPVTFRKPTGDDQENWAEMAFRDEREAARVMIGTLASSESRIKFRARDFDLIDEAMDEADPLVNFQCRVACAECGAENEFSVDLCDVALRMLARQQKQLIVMVHKLASRYHWSEKEIFAIPYWRRIEYLNLIAAGR
jgi:hypothetical protein